MNASTELLLAGFFGFLLGAMVTYLWSFDERRRNRSDAPIEPTVPAGASTVLSVLSSSAVVLDSSDLVVRSSAPAVAMGIVSDDRLVPEELMDLVRRVRRDGQVREAELSIQPARGPAVHVHARVAPLTSKLILVLADDRTLAERVEAIRRDFVANVSHELKTPVGAIGVLAEAIAEAHDDPDAVTRFAGRIQLESERLTRLVQQIIDLSRLQHDVSSDECVPVPVRSLVAEACEHSATDAEVKNITIAASIDSNPVVLGDRAQLHAAVSNLVENAVTYSPEGSRIAVTVAEEIGSIRITVTDNGIGIPAHEINRIFERFYRVDPARARSTGGTGLGLSIVKHVAASNGGAVEVWSEPGAGSSFTLVLPAYIEEDET